MLEAKPGARRTLLLIGAGHAHISVIRRLMMQPDPEWRLIVVAPSSMAPYSGMLPGFLARQYGESDLFIDVARLTEAAGGWFIRAEVSRVEATTRRVWVRRPRALGGALLPELRFDRLSINTGAQPEPGFGSAHPALFYVKPLTQLLADLPAVDALCEKAGAHLAIVGAGAAGIELAFAMRARHPELAITLIGKRPMTDDAALASGAKRIHRAMENRGVAWVAGEVVEADTTSLRLADGQQVAADVVWVATPAAPPAWLDATDLPRADSGFIAVDDRLQAVGCDQIYACGDVAELHAPRARSGVMAVRAGQYLAPILTQKDPAKAPPFTPQARWLTLLNLGDGTGIGIKGAWSFEGAWVWRWKQWIDRQFMTRFAVPPMSEAVAMRCEGCAAKLPGQALSSVLGFDFEDASVTTASGGMRLRSIDGLSYLLNDPHLMGELAVRHAVSDVWAMGGKPTVGQALIAVTRTAEPMLEAAEFAWVHAGIQAGASRYGLTLDGGHSLALTQPMVAMAVEGETERPIAKQGAQPGDECWLTGPIGSGLLFAGFKGGVISGRYIDGYLEQAHRSLVGLSEAATVCGVHAMTDVTGFGLAGHLNEMLGPLAERFVWADSIPIYAGVEACLAAGVQSTAAPSNREYAGALAHHAPSEVVFDPQTAGPLLVAVPAEASRALAEAWRALGVEPICIGRIPT